MLVAVSVGAGAGAGGFASGELAFRSRDEAADALAEELARAGGAESWALVAVSVGAGAGAGELASGELAFGATFALPAETVLAATALATDATFAELI